MAIADLVREILRANYGRAVPLARVRALLRGVSDDASPRDVAHAVYEALEDEES
jgi:hypothetical protein